MHIYHATYAAKLCLYRETRGIRAKNLDAAYKSAVKHIPSMEKLTGGPVELESIMKGVKAI